MAETEIKPGGGGAQKATGQRERNRNTGDPGPERRAVIVAGMHRSGTSAMARLLMLLGTSPPANIMPARPGNEAGHWEPERIVQLNDGLLASAGLAWDDVEPFPRSWIRSARARELQGEAIELLREEYGDSSLFVLKDPRICRIVPFWRLVLEELAIEPSFVMTIRNPLEVAASLKARDELSSGTGLLLWLRHVLDAERDTRGMRRVTISYDELVRDWRAVAKTISESLETPGADVAQRTGEEIEKFLSDAHRHQAFTREELNVRQEVVTWVKRAYSVLTEAAESRSEPDAAALDEIRASLSEADLAYGPVLAQTQLEAESKEERVQRLSEALAETKVEADRASAEVERLSAEAEQTKSELTKTQYRAEQTGYDLAWSRAEAERAKGELTGSRSEAERTKAALATQAEELKRVSYELALLRQGQRARVAAWYRSASQLASWIFRNPSRERLRYVRTYFALRRSHAFDSVSYGVRYPDVAATGLNPLMHYIEHGVREGRDPRLDFSTERYLAEHPQVAEAGINPLLHAFRTGADATGAGSPKPPARRIRARFRYASHMASWIFRRPSWQRLRYLPTYFSLRRSGAFDYEFYVTRYPDVAHAGLNPLMHYIEHGARDGRDPSPTFITQRYLEEHPELAESGVNPLLHAIRDQGHGWSDGADHPSATGAQAAVPNLAGQEDAYPSMEELSLVLPVGATALIALPEAQVSDLEGREAIPLRLPGGAVNGSRGQPDSVAAVARVEAARVRGAEFLALPRRGFDWAAGCAPFYAHLVRHYQVATTPGEDWAVFLLAAEAPERRPLLGQVADVVTAHDLRFPGPPAVLDWGTDLGIASHFTDLTVIEHEGGDGDRLPYLDDSIDLVALPSERMTTVAAEARRVGRNGLITAGPQSSAAAGLSLEWLREPEFSTPTVSIVIPTHSAPRHLRACLTALEETLPSDLEVEVLAVDDASTDGTAELLTRWEADHENVRHIRNAENLGFVESCNRGAEESRGEVVVFLNDDTIPLQGWLQPLLRTLSTRDDAGAVGGMLLYPDGRLQEAGAVIFSDGSGANFGRGDHRPGAPIYNFVREVDYCSGALLATTRELFDRLGGFDPRYRPGYYEDADYCFRVREAGLRVYYQPQSAVVHAEGATGGTSVSNGAKRFQEVNRDKFTDRWSESLKLQPSPPMQWTKRTWHELAHRTPPVSPGEGHDLVAGDRAQA